jgi:hypothetical protein
MQRQTRQPDAVVKLLTGNLIDVMMAAPVRPAEAINPDRWPKPIADCSNFVSSQAAAA